jgi:DNA-binding NarL/FixJ family response regulator
MQHGAQFSPSAVRAGASGYLALDSRPEDFLAAIDVAVGRTPGAPIPPDVCA